MTTTKSNLLRFGAWGQIILLALASIFWYFGLTLLTVISGIGYLVVTTIGIIGIARSEEAISGPIGFPLLIPGFVPLIYFANQYA